MKTTIILLLVALAGSALAMPVPSLFSDHKSFTEGDVITILLWEETSATVSSGSETDRSFEHGAELEQGQGSLDFIPMASFGLSGANTFKGDASTNRSGKLRGRMTARIVSIDDSGNLMIKGSRSVEINGEEEITQLEGLIRPQDVQSDNSVYSYNIADAKITYKGDGPIDDGSRVGLITRLFNFLF